MIERGLNTDENNSTDNNELSLPPTTETKSGKKN